MSDQLPPPRAVSFFGLPLFAGTAGELLALVQSWMEQPADAPRLLAYLNAHTTNLLCRDSAFRQAMEQMAVVYADGMAVVKASRRLGGGLPERVNAGDFLGTLLWSCRSRGRRVALVGSTAPVVAHCAKLWQRRIPGLKFCLVHHGHFALDGEEEARLLDRLRRAAPHLLLVGMGSPRQELWAVRHAESLGIPVVWCVGALFEYSAGRRRAPAWMRQAGLEWLWRLAMEPRRLAARYLLGNAEFLWRVARERRKRRAES